MQPPGILQELHHRIPKDVWGSCAPLSAHSEQIATTAIMAPTTVAAVVSSILTTPKTKKRGRSQTGSC